jgi:hypothetical protein
LSGGLGVKVEDGRRSVSEKVVPAEVDIAGGERARAGWDGVLESDVRERGQQGGIGCGDAGRIVEGGEGADGDGGYRG